MPMRLTHTCLITPDVRRLRDFYAKALRMRPSNDSEAYVEFTVGDTILSLWDLAGHLKQAPGTAEARANRSLIVEFQVDDVDAEFERMRGLGAEIAKAVTTQEWGNRSFYFRDPDGNLVNFFSRVQKA